MNRKQEQEAPVRQGPPPVHIEDQTRIAQLLFAQKERPKNLHEVRIVNVFDNRYRINVWTRVEEDGFDKTKIHSSYFARYDGETLDIRA